MIRLASLASGIVRSSSAVKFQLNSGPKRESVRPYVSESLMSSTFAAATKSTGAERNQNQNAVAPMSRICGFDRGPLVWIDLEMTGLNARTDEIMEIAVSR